jgi:hypothetical protein
MTQAEKIADLLETVTLRCFASMFHPGAAVLSHMVGKNPITGQPIGLFELDTNDNNETT